MDNSAGWADTLQPSKYFTREEKASPATNGKKPAAETTPHPRPDGPKPRRRERKQRGALLQKEGVWRNDESALHDPARMVRDCRAALDDPNSWLTHGYTAAIHLKYLLQGMGFPVPGDPPGDPLRKEE